MFGLGWSEFLVISAVTIVVVGPQEIPRVLRTVSEALRKVRGFATDFQDSIMDIADLDDVKQDIVETTADLKKHVDMDGIRQEWETDWDVELGLDTDIDTESHAFLNTDSQQNTGLETDSVLAKDMDNTDTNTRTKKQRAKSSLNKV